MFFFSELKRKRALFSRNMNGVGIYYSRFEPWRRDTRSAGDVGPAERRSTLRFEPSRARAIDNLSL
jgi:hypothetical protein